MRLPEAILEMIYPRRCPVCGKIVIPKGTLICKECREKLIYIKEPRCKKCSKPIEQEEAEYCYDCGRRQYQYEFGYAMWVYDKVMKESIANYKYKHCREYCDFYLQELLFYYREKIEEMQVDAIIPVPIHKKKKRIRGFNQAELIANGIGASLDIPVYSNILIRIKNTKPQKELDDKERYYNLSEAFGIEDPKGLLKKVNRILIVDDIYTTGNTIDACSTMLKKANIDKIYFFCLCIGRGY